MHQRTIFGTSIRSRLLLALLSAAIVSLSATVEVAGQSRHGRIIGRVLDSESGRGLVGAQIVVDGANPGTLTGIDARYVLTSVPRGPVSLTVSYLGYAEKTVTGVQIPSSGAATLDIGLNAAALSLEGITVTVAGEQGRISRALEEQPSAVGFVNAVTSEQISRSPDSDAAAAIQRVSGVSVQDGKYVFVRGLGERYTTTFLNGSRIPSPDPERKVAPLDLFPSGLLQSITTSRTFTPNLAGDFSGGQVDIRTREFPAKRQVTYSTRSVSRRE